MAYNHLNFVAKKSTKIEFDAFSELILANKKVGYTLVKRKTDATPLHLSKKNNPQVMFMNKEGERIYTRVSKSLYELMEAGDDSIDFMESPVYNVDVIKDGVKQGNMLVIGVEAAGDADEWEAVAEDAAIYMVK